MAPYVPETHTEVTMTNQDRPFGLCWLDLVVLRRFLSADHDERIARGMTVGRKLSGASV